MVNIKRLMIFVILNFLTEVLCAPVHNVLILLKKYGYLQQDIQFSNQMTGTILENAVKKFQQSAGLEITGTLDSKTASMLAMPRCGVLDDITVEPIHLRRKRYVTSGKTLLHNYVTYKISKYSKSLFPRSVDFTIKEAFKTWSDVTNLDFIQKTEGDVDIDIRFEEGMHADSSFVYNILNAFDGPNGDLGHAYQDANFLLRIHFDDAENWTMFGDSDISISLFNLATHEIGHTLGLNHTVFWSAVMFPYYTEPKYGLHANDKSTIRSLYGTRNEEFMSKNNSSPFAELRYIYKNINDVVSKVARVLADTA